jgi:hypothetical protein
LVINEYSKGKANTKAAAKRFLRRIEEKWMK